MAKAAAYQRLARLKRALIVTSLLGFGAFAGLATQHRIGVTSAGSATQATMPSDSNFFSPADDAQGGYGIGQNPAPPPAISGSSAS